MDDLMQKLVQIEMDLSEQVGGFILFAAFERGDLIEKWDILVSFNIELLEGNKNIEFIAKYFQKKLPLDYLVKISRIVFLKPTDKFVREINTFLEVEHSPVEIENKTFSNLNINRAYLITSRSRNT